MTTKLPSSPDVPEAYLEVGQIIRDHLYSRPGAAHKWAGTMSESRPMDRHRCARLLGTTYGRLAQILSGNSFPTEHQWTCLMTGRSGGRPILPFTAEELDTLQRARETVAASRTAYTAERVAGVRARWLGWLEEGDQLSLDMLKAEIIEKLQHLRQPYL